MEARRCITFAVALAVFGSVGSKSGAEPRQLGAHAHGTGVLNVAIEGKTLAIELTVPASDIVGFEHAPRSAEEIERLKASEAALQEPLALFQLPEAAACQAGPASVTVSGAGAEDADGKAKSNEHKYSGHGHDGHHHDHSGDANPADGGPTGAQSNEDGEAHTEFLASYTFLCEKPKALTTLALPYFKKFGKAEKLDARIVAGNGQTAGVATRERPVLSLSTAR